MLQKLITYQPTCLPPNQPTYLPTYLPTYQPTYQPTYLPTDLPTFQPTYLPTYIPTYLPTYIPTDLPTFQPTYLPTYIPTYLPSYLPTFLPTYLPTYLPTFLPTYLPTYLPTHLPLSLSLCNKVSINQSLSPPTPHPLTPTPPHPPALQKLMTTAPSELPSQSDVSGALAAILRLQRVYNLSTEQVYAGNYSGFTGPALSPLDAFRVGQQAFTDGMLAHSEDWLRLAVREMQGRKAATSTELNTELKHFPVEPSLPAVVTPDVVALRAEAGFTASERAAAISLLGRVHKFVSIPPSSGVGLHVATTSPADSLPRWQFERE